MPNTWLTSDTHFGHCNIIKYSNRPFKDHDAMNEGMIARFNEVLRPGDTLYHLGDVCHTTFELKKWLDRMPGIQVHLIYGNHDKPKLLQHPKIVWAGDYKGVTIGENRFELFHYPIRSWNHKGRGAYHCFGHCHGSLPNHDRSMDVGVDTHQYYPYHVDEVIKILKDVPYFMDNDKEHHNKEEKK
jgi:calcineurin-like phosphoesterase family protein